ncbi:MAG TPA: ATP synthase F0 subunit B [Bryobacteraceae bacterium]|nr:ATP synthase F0 subunit B [Bryobacteraceae bacterium]
MRRLLAAAFVMAGMAFAQQYPPPPVTRPTVPPPAHRAEAAAEHEEAMPNELMWKWANFGILVLGLGYLIGKNAGPFFRSRTEEIQKGIREAAAMRADAEKRAAGIEARIANLTADVEALRQSSHQEIEAEHERMQSESTQQLAKLEAHAQQEIASAAKNATLDLKSAAAELALKLAEQQIRNRVTPQVQDALVNGFIGDLKNNVRNGNGAAR